ncbi:MAG: mycothiol system anti-sigma-R factor [Actinobacteria bacterium]|jgi:anti-sigma factor (TIGR02949 family)|nr:zf-HC2 domain-containing protein [Actinomycetota bacterium]MCO5299489.1 zf-HC2 domain-containing protein [Candidatus Nanopelagicales bacterium]MCB9428082.1 mycothiol system anti-sigma-R factor [Actinomycetota bacterium]HPE12923.1 zf-HC2 domain-containing protein [Actinomycetota bacterium]HPJ19987.1 zf-HC2 domain-containing protein [Actinomycetota bacterium]
MNAGGCADPGGCEDADKHLYEYQHHELTPDVHQRIKDHLDACGHCQELYREEEIIRRKVAQCACEAAPEQLRTRVISLIATFRTTRS